MKIIEARRGQAAIGAEKNRRISMLKFAVAAAFAALLLVDAGSASAQRYTNYPVCAVYSGFSPGNMSCAFMNFAQCRASVSGRGGYCQYNADYRPPTKRARR